MEQLWRCFKSTSTEILFIKNMTGTVSQEKFFANIKNKISSISFFIGKFKAINICAKQAKVDAEILIVETALTSTKNNKNITVIVGDDVDLLVILTVRNPPNMDFSPRQCDNVRQKIYS